MNESANHNRRPLIIRPEQGRRYEMGRTDAAGLKKAMSIVQWFAANPLGDMAGA
jgi:hypothetical protein